MTLTLHLDDAVAALRVIGELYAVSGVKMTG